HSRRRQYLLAPPASPWPPAPCASSTPPPPSPPSWSRRPPETLRANFTGPVAGRLKPAGNRAGSYLRPRKGTSPGAVLLSPPPTGLLVFPPVPRVPFAC